MSNELHRLLTALTLLEAAEEMLIDPAFGAPKMDDIMTSEAVGELTEPIKSRISHALAVSRPPLRLKCSIL